MGDVSQYVHQYDGVSFPPRQVCCLTISYYHYGGAFQLRHHHDGVSMPPLTDWCLLKMVSHYLAIEMKVPRYSSVTRMVSDISPSNWLGFRILPSKLESTLRSLHQKDCVSQIILQQDGHLIKRWCLKIPPLQGWHFSRHKSGVSMPPSTGWCLTLPSSQGWCSNKFKLCDTLWRHIHSRSWRHTTQMHKKSQSVTEW